MGKAERTTGCARWIATLVVLSSVPALAQAPASLPAENPSSVPDAPGDATAAALDLGPEARALAEELLGFHPCGDHWNDYKNFCEFYIEDGRLRVRTHGDHARLEGEVVPVDAQRFELKGELRQLRAPWPDDADFPDDCDLEGTFLFRRTGKRRYWRHVKTCRVTFYFDVFAKRLTRDEVDARLERIRARKRD